MKQLVGHTPEAPLSDELLGLLLDEAERALLAVDARADDTGQRVLHGNVPDPDRECAPGVNELRLAIAELADAFPTIHADLETIGERMRNLGAKAGTSELESYPHVLDLVRMSLEVLFRNHPSADSYETDHRQQFGVPGEDSQTPAETYEAYAQLLAQLRVRLS